ncbi:hypothetical protein HDF26_001959 [Pedobacter cryoconitis]|uniref:hypothetical protein n=1 Tax=Pedobacter cryoconitis TaxID=188932 RepID=UPI0016230DAE|nr:hypothetical protein [Pedobacter cryoconitis]MBB6271532.1 hypothetical protein [Pedobacter cryoconitis]
MIKNILTVFLIICSNYSFSQVSATSAKRINNILYNVLDKTVGQMFTFKKVSNYIDGSAMNDSKCDHIIFIKYKTEYFKREYGNKLDIRWFGCDELKNDNQIRINKVLATYSTAYIPEGIFKISATIVVPEKAELYGEGNKSVIKLMSVRPVDALSVYRWVTLRNFKLDCSKTDMDLSAAILVNPWNGIASTAGELRIKELVITGNYPQLQGVGIKLKIESDKKYPYQIIAFSKFYDIDIYGFRDGISCELNYNNSNNISFINANVFDNIIIHNCLRPVRIINNANEDQIAAGKSSISSNFFKNFIVQHVVGEYPAFYIDGGIYNDISGQIVDWTGSYIETSKNSQKNTIKFTPDNPSKIRILK